MNALDGIIYGFGVVFTYQNLLAAFAGAFAGTAIGVLPGLGPTAGIAMILPISYSFDPTTGLIMMAGMYYGAMYGGSTTAILVNMPGEAGSIMTCVDGYEMTKKGRGGAALTIVAVGSFIGGTFATLGVMLFAPLLADFTIEFGPIEFFAMAAGGLLLFSRISGGTFAAGVFPMAIGLVLSTVGQEAVSGLNRFTFGFTELSLGIELVAVVVGVYGVAEIMSVVETKESQVRPAKVKIRELLPNREEWRRSWAPFGRGTVLGFLLGLLPGPHTTLSSFISYRLEQAVSKYRHELGTGAIEGVAGPETANNAAATATMVPLLALGLPFGAVTALMLSAMMVQGIQPGPMLVITHPEIFWGLIASMYAGNVMLLLLNVPMIGIWVSMLRIPLHIFLPAILLLAIIGAYSVNNSMLDVFVLIVMGIFGYILKKCDFQLAPMVIGLVLGPMIEKDLREGMFMSLGDVSAFWTSPVAIVIWLIVLVTLLGSPVRKLVRRILGVPEGEAIPNSEE
ncbi:MULTISPECIES: tripartite tricarboxylate transporter permease [unclassified Mesorhizobium]|uniref:tripartite tricarboxylate transporter permease n=1 Tax=unclassified Mesorhizobium TaxID=325217 RepID=UPI0015E3C625|nr:MULTISPECIES: tripartite tricarboxylate transporter permease [unclassified Mesorhizobium]MBZ9894373.1 tripartite tricarboxylate transporter permease [Mesorhizobium sp. BR1-1-6]